MKLRSVRLAEVGPFFDGVAVDGIPAGLGVLIGPNELGKSTVLRALHLLFSEPHTAQNKTVKACRSYQGGAPLVEAEFELGGRVFRLRKRYLAGKFADLVSLGDGRMWRNQEAEEEIARLLANHQAVAGGRGLLWVEQTKSFSIPSGKEHEELGNALAGFIKCEAAAVAGGDGLARVRRLAAQSLSELVTAGRQQPKKGGPLALAMQERERLAGELKAAEAARVQADTRTRTLAELRERERDLGCPERARQGDAERVAAEHALEAAKLARARLETTTYKVQGLEAEFQAKAGELNRARALLTELNRLDVELAEFRQKRILRGDALAEADAEVADLQREARDFECRAEVVQGRLRDSEARLRAEQLARSLVECTRRLDAVRSAMQRARALDGELASKAGIPGDVSALRSLEHERQVLLALQTTAAARLEVRYLPGGTHGVRFDGRPLGDGESVSVERAATVEIEGIGDLIVVPGGIDELERTADRLATVVADSAAILKRHGVADLDAAEAALEAYETGQRELAAARSEVAVLAPEGTERLEREVAALEQEIALAGCSGEDASRIGEASQPEHHRDELALLTSALREKRRAIDERRSVRDALRLEVGGLDSEIGHREQRHAALAEELPLPEARGQLIERLAQERDQLQGRLGEAVRDADVWRTKAPDDAAFAGMEQQIAEHEARRRREGEELNDLRVQISALEGRMAELREIDLKTRVEELGAALQRAEDRVGDLEQEVAALVLIEREIAAAEESLQERVLVPLMDRLGPLVERVLDGASLELAGPLEVAKIRRGQQVAPASDLSDGTREQIAVMVRLAYARMFADLGVAMPLILDDALVFSDDDRLEAMFAMLAEAAAAHQVIVLTCHDRAFRPLIDRHGAKGLGFAPWDSVALPIAG